VLETSLPTAFQRLDVRDGDLGVSLPENQAKRQTAILVPEDERLLGRKNLAPAAASARPRLVFRRRLSWRLIAIDRPKLKQQWQVQMSPQMC
jgi:hypothetical protein